MTTDQKWPFRPGDYASDSGPDGDDAAWLEAAPIGTVVQDCDGDEWTRRGDLWHMFDDSEGRTSVYVAQYAPTVVSVGGGS
jgi:hypothetical protein